MNNNGQFPNQNNNGQFPAQGNNGQFPTQNQQQNQQFNQQQQAPAFNQQQQQFNPAQQQAPAQQFSQQQPQGQQFNQQPSGGEMFVDFNEQPAVGFGLLPNGRYHLRITASEFCANSAGTGSVLKLQETVIGGALDGRIYFENFNIQNANPMAQQIGQREYAALCKALFPDGYREKNANKLIGLEFIADIEKYTPRKKANRETWNDNESDDIIEPRNRITGRYPAVQQQQQFSPAQPQGQQFNPAQQQQPQQQQFNQQQQPQGQQFNQQQAPAQQQQQQQQAPAQQFNNQQQQAPAGGFPDAGGSSFPTM